MTHECLLLQIGVEEAERGKDGTGEQVKRRELEGRVDRLSGEHREEGEEELRLTERFQSDQGDVERDILVERQIHTVAVSPVVVPSMHLSIRWKTNAYKHQLDEVVELANDVVCAVHRCVSLLSLDSNSHRALANHRNVVCSVANRKTTDSLRFHQNNHARLLLRGHTAADHRGCVAQRKDELLLRQADQQINR